MKNLIINNKYMDKIEFRLGQINQIAKDMEAVQKEYPEADIIYDARENRIYITYPLPEDYYNLRKVSFTRNPNDLFTKQK